MSDIVELAQAIERLHGCKLKHLESVPVKETFQGKTVWQGVVEVDGVTVQLPQEFLDLLFRKLDVVERGLIVLVAITELRQFPGMNSTTLAGRSSTWCECGFSFSKRQATTSKLGFTCRMGLLTGKIQEFTRLSCCQVRPDGGHVVQDRNGP